MEGAGKFRKQSTENRQLLNGFSLGTISSMVTIAILLHFAPVVHSSALRGGPSLNVSKRSIPDAMIEESYPDYFNDDYPVNICGPCIEEGIFASSGEQNIEVPKRAALIFDRILKGLQSATENNPFVNDWSPVTRRGNSKDKLYFRCYFNAVSCYKKK